MSTIRYAGIGARDTPEDVCGKMFTAGRTMAKLGFILRSGGASGADSAFEAGVMAAAGDEGFASLAEIYLPWKGFRQNQSPLFGSSRDARMLAKEFHPNWNILSCAGRDFHTRNVYQILGNDLKTPSAFVLCWTPKGAITGGTGQALRIAKAYDIPILNFAVDDDQHISNFILELSERK